MVDRRLHDDLRKIYLHLKAPRFDLHRPLASSARSESAPCILQVFGPEEVPVDRMRGLNQQWPFEVGIELDFFIDRVVCGGVLVHDDRHRQTLARVGWVA